jgi:hypothetical protein
MTILRGLIGVVVALAVTVGFVQFLELMLANAFAGHGLQSLGDYALILNTVPMLVARLLITSLLSILGGYLCAKIAERDEMRYTLIAAIFRVIAVVGGTTQGYMPPMPTWMLVVLLIISTLAMLAGGAVRAAAASIQRSKIERRRRKP